MIKDILSKLPIGGSDNKMSEGEQIQAQSKAYNFDPNNIAPPEVQQQLLALLKWRDGVYRDVVKTMEMIPGLDDLIDQLSNALNACEKISSPYRSKSSLTSTFHRCVYSHLALYCRKVIEMMLFAFC